MTADDWRSGAVNRVEQLELIERLNEYERVVPLYRQVLERIADVRSTMHSEYETEGERGHDQHKANAD